MSLKAFTEAGQRTAEVLAQTHTEPTAPQEPTKPTIGASTEDMTKYEEAKAAYDAAKAEHPGKVAAHKAAVAEQPAKGLMAGFAAFNGFKDPKTWETIAIEGGEQTRIALTANEMIQISPAAQQELTKKEQANSVRNAAAKNAHNLTDKDAIIALTSRDTSQASMQRDTARNLTKEALSETQDILVQGTTDTKLGLAGNASLENKAIILKLAKDPDVKVKTEIAGNPQAAISKAAMKELSRNDQPVEVTIALAGNTGLTDAETILKLAQHENEEVRKAIAGNTAIQHSPEAQEILASPSQPDEIRLIVAGNTGLNSKKAITSLGSKRTKPFALRGQMSKNPAIAHHESMQTSMADNGDLANSLSDNIGLSSEKAQEKIAQQYAGIIPTSEKLAKNPALSSYNAIWYLAQSPHETVRDIIKSRLEDFKEILPAAKFATIQGFFSGQDNIGPEAKLEATRA